MKRILFLLLPLLVAIGVLFSLQSRNFDFADMLTIFSRWSFADSLDAFVEMRDTFNEVGEIWETIEDSQGFWDTIARLGDLVVTIIKGLGQLVLSLGYLLLDFVDNILQIVEYLFFYEYTPRT